MRASLVPEIDELEVRIRGGDGNRNLNRNEVKQVAARGAALRVPVDPARRVLTGRPVPSPRESGRTGGGRDSIESAETARVAPAKRGRRSGSIQPARRTYALSLGSAKQLACL
jgi:hypothetical protein